jgi:hypothetical protein
VTAHLDKVEGAVIVFPEEPQEVNASEQARSAAITEKRSDLRVARALRIAGTAVVAATEEPNAFKMPTKDGAGMVEIGLTDNRPGLGAVQLARRL